ncbi:hypothetical protein NPIL_160771, partial [Nephila pilipes]
NGDGFLQSWERFSGLSPAYWSIMKPRRKSSLGPWLADGPSLQGPPKKNIFCSCR